MKKIIPIIILIVVLLQISSTYKEDYYIIPNKSIRIRIIPNSNSLKDQNLKKQVKTNIELQLIKDLKNVTDIETTRTIVQKNINSYKKTIKKVLKNEQSTENYKIDYGNHYFPEKTYKGVKYKAGNYESLLITLGKGEGDNWWCVIFPPICALEDEENQKDIEYSLYIKEMFEKYIK